MHLNLNTILLVHVRAFTFESWQNDIRSFGAVNVALTVSFKLISFNIYNNSNNRIHIAPYGLNLRGAGGRLNQCS